MQKFESYGTDTVLDPLMFEVNSNFKTFSNDWFRFVKDDVSDMRLCRKYPRLFHTQSNVCMEGKYANTNRLYRTSAYLPSSVNLMDGDVRCVLQEVPNVIG